MRRQKSLRIGVHHANAVVWGPVYRTHLSLSAFGLHSPTSANRILFAAAVLPSNVYVACTAYGRTGRPPMDDSWTRCTKVTCPGVKSRTGRTPSLRCVELKGVRSGVERRRGRGLKARGGRRESPGSKVLKDQRSPRRRGRMGTSVILERA